MRPIRPNKGDRSYKMRHIYKLVAILLEQTYNKEHYDN
jgi:hypothetical protein